MTESDNNTKQKNVANWQIAIQTARGKFEEIASRSDLVTYAEESMFAMQQILKNDFTLETAISNPNSLKHAIINVAAVGLSLNPATKFAYLVPRDKEICLDISYMGLIKIATDTGSILWAKAELVYSMDSFEYCGAFNAPIHKADVFSKERGELVGVYCIARTRDGEYLTEVMTADDVEGIKEKSKAAKSKYSPWVNFPGEMWKKSVIKRASKTWPKTDRSDRFDEAVHLINQHDGLTEDYIDATPQIGTDSVDVVRVAETSLLCRQVVDDDDEEKGPQDAQRLYQSLSPDEQIALQKRLKKDHPKDATGVEIRKTYWSCFKDHLDSARRLENE